jgi:phosphatidylglycerol:prolipoprotein diacylglycerol transferase
MGEVLFPAFDPVLLDLPGPFDIRWYGLMYVVAFIAGQTILTRLCRSGFLPMPEQRVGDLILWLVVGVLVGGRLGHAIFYERQNLDPRHFIEVWKGGLSFHGGLVGVVVTVALFARKAKLPGWRLGDAMALAVTPGIFAVRCANFINGELFGRVTTASVPWAMRFPTDSRAAAVLGTTGLEIRERELKTLQAMHDGTWQRVMHDVPLRHPSQIYEALGEGLLMGLVMLLLYRATRARRLSAGVYGGIFLAGYGVVRFGLEFFREPDPQLGYVLGPFTRGQQLCFAMIVVGLGIVLLRRGKGPGPQPGADPAVQPVP